MASSYLPSYGYGSAAPSSGNQIRVPFGSPYQHHRSAPFNCGEGRSGPLSGGFGVVDADFRPKCGKAG